MQGLVVSFYYKYLVAACQVCYYGACLRRIRKMRTIITASKIRPITIIAQAQAGVEGGAAASVVGGADSVRKLKVADQSLGTGSRAITLQKYARSYSSWP